MSVYLDNAASTPLDKEVLNAMMPYMLEHYGNPSSIHTHGREARSVIEKARKTIANLLNAAPSEIFFTSGGTEADNTAIQSSIQSYKIKNAITTPIEHHAVLHTLETLEKKDEIKIHFVNIDEKGRVDMAHLESLMQKYSQSLVSIMHANNEVGTINDIYAIGELSQKYQCVFHSDTVQTMGHYKFDLKQLKANFIVASAHKFHGPKGVGFLYINSDTKIPSLIHGGSQERNMRGGTENVYGIVGLAKALEIANENLEKDQAYIKGLKVRMIDKLKASIPDITFNGDCLNLENSLYTVLNISTPKNEINEMLLFNLDIHKISVSGGSACSSGTDIGSHVLRFLKADPEKAHVRFSFSKYNTPEEIDYVVEKLAGMF